MHNYYNNLLESGKLKSDKAQAVMATRLEELKLSVNQYTKKRKLISRIKPAAKPKGLFIYGKVGRGKSMLMDGFFSVVQTQQKRRVHFHEFMQGVHTKLHELRGKGAKGQRDIVEEVAKQYARNLKLLCFDEFEVADVTDAMILSKLFKTMADEGVVFVITSNKRPEDHYKDGLQRKTYLEFCEYLAGVVEMASLEAQQDFRLIQKAESENYFCPLNYQTTKRLKEKLKLLTEDAELEPVVVKVKGREVKLRGVGKVAVVDFASLCGAALGAADYLAIAKKFEVLFLENIPKMTEENRNEARRFINLVDILYENKVLLIASAEAEPDGLYTEATSGSFEFNRTASRLVEMRGWKAGGK